MSLTKSSQFANDSADDDNDMRCVLDIVCINDPNERNIKFQVMNQDFEALKIQAEKLINENPDEVKETLIIFTKIVQRIKDSREKLKSLKMRLRVCKNTFSSSFEKTDNITRMYLKSKECASLLKKMYIKFL
ncbi:hypothetical protein HZS_4397 [Henneguya salminicola]|nr:hypothetical protein HZS_4397 [Henneguya salminicola]